MHSRSLCYSLRSDEKSRSWRHGLLGSVYAWEVKVDGDEAGQLVSHYYFLRSDVWCLTVVPLHEFAYCGHPPRHGVGSIE